MTPFQIVIVSGLIMFVLGVFLGNEIRASLSIKLADDWRIVARYAWSVRLIAVAAVLSGLEVMLPIIGYRLPVSNIGLAILNFIIVAAALIARFVAQEKIDT